MGAQTQQMIMGVVMWIAVFAVFYFLLIRPQKKKDKQLKEMRENIKVGDKVVTIGGIVGEVASVKSDEVVLSVGPNKNKIPFEKWAIGTISSETNSAE